MFAGQQKCSFLKPPPLSRDNSGGSSNDSGNCSSYQTSTASSSSSYPPHPPRPSKQHKLPEEGGGEATSKRRAMFATRFPKASLDEQKLAAAVSNHHVVTSHSVSQGRITAAHKYSQLRVIQCDVTPKNHFLLYCKVQTRNMNENLCRQKYQCCAVYNHI